MRKIGMVLASVALAVGMLFFGSYIGATNSMRKAKAQTAPSQPNIVFILTDDMRKDDLKYMPKTKALLQTTGMTFENHHARAVFPQQRGVVRLLDRQLLHNKRRLAGLPAKR
jgi:hypothetical protein